MEHADAEDMALGRDSLVDKVVASVAGAHADSAAARIYALLGPWGSGKSWILDRVLKELRDGSAGGADPVVEFNPWLFGSEEAIGRGFATALVSKAGGTQKRRRAVAGAIDNYGPVVTPHLSRFGVDSSELGKRLSGRLSDVGSPAGIRAMLTKATEDQRLIVVMDDLDRLTPDELLMVFKLMRLVGDIPTITYLLAYDETTLLGQVAKSSIGGNSSERARLYVEKVVERTFIVPPLSMANLDNLVIRPIVNFGSGLFPLWSESDCRPRREPDANQTVEAGIDRARNWLHPILRVRVHASGGGRRHELGSECRTAGSFGNHGIARPCLLVRQRTRHTGSDRSCRIQPSSQYPNKMEAVGKRDRLAKSCRLRFADQLT